MKTFQLRFKMLLLAVLFVGEEPCKWLLFVVAKTSLGAGVDFVHKGSEICLSRAVFFSFEKVMV